MSVRIESGREGVASGRGGGTTAEGCFLDAGGPGRLQMAAELGNKLELEDEPRNEERKAGSDAIA